MTHQQAFNRIARHLMKQGEHSKEIGDYGSCLYRGPNGTKCAIGALIPDSQYDENFEGEDLVVIRMKARALKGLRIAFLSEMQGVHDNNDPDKWAEELLKFAKQHRLKIPACIQVPA